VTWDGSGGTGPVLSHRPVPPLGLRFGRGAVTWDGSGARDRSCLTARCGNPRSRSARRPRSGTKSTKAPIPAGIDASWG